MTKEQVLFYGELFKELGLSELKVVNKDEEVYLKKDICATSVNYQDNDNQEGSMNMISEKLFCNDISDNTESNILDITNTDSISKDSRSIGINNDIVQESVSNLIPVKAPLVGIYYAKPSPSAEAFVKVGDYVNKGDVLCIIEAMKMFNEIKAEVSGRIEEICVNNGNVVEYGQTLFNIAE